jgi:membrane protease YdiL (CAAX protease family)
VIVSVIAGMDSFQEYYPIYGDADRSLAMFVSYEIAYACYFVAWEFFFRGFMTFALEKHLGIWVIFVQMLPFAVMHFGKPGLESMSSVFGGIALGYLALRSRSIWYGVFIHAATAVTLDVLVVGIRWYRG